jgi:hypothetical protein
VRPPALPFLLTWFALPSLCPSMARILLGVLFSFCHCIFNSLRGERNCISSPVMRILVTLQVVDRRLASLESRILPLPKSIILSLFHTHQLHQALVTQARLQPLIEKRPGSTVQSNDGWPPRSIAMVE